MLSGVAMYHVLKSWKFIKRRRRCVALVMLYLFGIRQPCNCQWKAFGMTSCHTTYIDVGYFTGQGWLSISCWSSPWDTPTERQLEGLIDDLHNAPSFCCTRACVWMRSSLWNITALCCLGLQSRDLYFVPGVGWEVQGLSDDDGRETCPVFIMSSYNS